MTTIPINTHRRRVHGPGGLASLTACLLLEATGGLAAAGHLVRGGAAGVLTPARPSVLLRGTLDAPPVMLIHGLGSDCSTLLTLARALHATGHTVYLMNYSSVGVDIATCGRRLAIEAAELRAATGASRISVVAHSLGGVIARWAIANTRMGDSVDTAITLASPHAGSPLARLAPARIPGFAELIRQLRPGSTIPPNGPDDAQPSVAQNVQEPPSSRPEDGTDPVAGTSGPTHDGRRTPARWVVVAGQLDWVVPPRYAGLPERENVRTLVLSGCGHLSLPSDPRCIALVRRELAYTVTRAQPLVRAA